MKLENILKSINLAKELDEKKLITIGDDVV